MMAALLAATTMVAGAMPAVARAQQAIDQAPHGRHEGPPRGGPGGPAGRLERNEGRPVFNSREAFPENRPAFRPDHAEAPRAPQPAPPPQAAPVNRGEWRDRGQWGGRGGGFGGGPRPGQDQPRPDDRGGWNRPGGYAGDPRPAPRPDQGRPDQVRPDRGPDGVRVDRGWRDDPRRQREDRDRWQRSFGDWRDHSDQAYGFAERRAWANQWNRGWRQDRRYDWLSWRSMNRGAYHLPRYYAPYGGYDYQRFSSGVIIDPIFFGQSYWLDDPFAYRLPPAYGSYRWVRYYNDAILVDLRSGLVVDVVYDIFW